MSRKDYELIAAAVRDMDVSEVTAEYIAGKLADRLASDNARFNKQTFIKAATANA